MNSLSDAINSLKIENRFDAVMGKIGMSDARERIIVPEASHKTAARTKGVTESTAAEPSLKR